MNKTFTQEQLQLMKTVIQSTNQNQRTEQNSKSIEWTGLDIVLITYHIAMNPNDTQVKCIKDLKETIFTNRTQSSIKQLIKRFNKEYEKQNIIDLTEQLIKTHENINYSKMILAIEEKRNNEKFQKDCEGLIDPPDSFMEQLELQIMNQLNQKYGIRHLDFPPKTILMEYPEITQSLQQIVKLVQEISEQNEQAAINRFLACNLNLNLVKQSLQNQNIIWSKQQDSQLNECLIKGDNQIIALFQKFKGKQNVSFRKDYLQKLRNIGSKVGKRD